VAIFAPPKEKGIVNAEEIGNNFLASIVKWGPIFFDFFLKKMCHSKRYKGFIIVPAVRAYIILLACAI
jgi:hypothetical protein